MSATVNGTARSVDHPMPHLGDNSASVERPNGTLWERVAEFGANQEALGLLDASKRYADAWLRAHATGERIK